MHDAQHGDPEADGIWANGVSPNPVLVEVSGGPSWINSDF